MNRAGGAFIAVVDLETTGFAPPQAVPIELGRVRLAAGTDLLGDPDWRSAASEAPPLAQLYSPEGRPVPPESSAVHHLVASDLAFAPLWPAYVRVIVQAQFPGCTALSAHSADFEKQWLTPAVLGAQLPWIDTWKCALRAWPQAPGHSVQCLRYCKNPPGLVREFAQPAHRAGPAAYAAALLLRELLREHELATLLQWSAEPAILVRVPFGHAPPEGSRGMCWTEVDEGLLHWTLDRDFSADIHHTCRVELARRAAAAAEPAA